jgi:hypothetical protein
MLAALDVLLQLGALLLIGWAFGLRCLAVAAVVWGCNGAANFYWTGGAFLRQDWYFALILALCLARKRKFFWSGAALTWSALLRVFPVVFFAGVGVIVVLRTLRTRQLHADHRRFLLGSVLAALVLGGASAVVSGPHAYAAFAERIRSHEHTRLTNNMGLPVLLAHSWQNRMQFTFDDRLDDPVQIWKESHAARLAALHPLWLVLCAGVFAWLAWALSKTRLLWVGMALSVALLVCVLDLTCYYYVFFVALVPLIRLRPQLAPAFLALAGASQALLAQLYWIDDRYFAQSLLFCSLAACVLHAFSRPLAVSRPHALTRGSP